jgi:predicted AlkP superfamily phosphohydrolase/phosphomutase
MMKRAPSLAICMVVLAAALSLCLGHCIRKNKPRVRMAIIGVDAATWDIMNPLLEKGDLPNMERLIQRGVHMKLRTFPVTHKSPVLWTSILTGKKPPKHGIEGYFSVKGFPVNSTMRKVKYLPQIIGEAGYKTACVGFWATWPAEKIDGWLVSDLASYGRFVDAFGGQAGRGFKYLEAYRDVTCPENLLHEIYPLFLEPDKIPRQTFARFAKFSDEEWEEFQDITRVSREDDLSLLKYSVVTDLNFHRVGLYLVETRKPDVYAVYFEGLDIIEHFFWKYMEPEYFSKVSEKNVDRFGDTIYEYYKFMDDYVGETVKTMGPDTVYIVLSDHGQIRVPREGVDGLHSGTHIRGRPPGILVMAGPNIRKHQGMLDVEPGLLDVMPTILYLSGMPVAGDMDGEVIKQVFDPKFLAENPIKTITTYETEPMEKKEEPSPLDSQIIQKLRAIGYIK